MKMKNLFSKALMIVASGVFAVGCTSGDKAPEIGKGVALFDNFTYEGNDRFYNENPLPDAQSFYTPILPGWYSDPSICTNGEGDYFLVTSTFTYFPVCLSSIVVTS
jgi:alpha-N-arabinofuranosidase